MTERPTLEQLPMTLGYFRLILRAFGDTPDKRAAILAGTGVTEETARDRPADISLFQQVRQVENVSGLFGEGWVFRTPELWNPSSHGALGVAALAAPDVGGMVDVLVRFAYVRAPFYSLAHGRGTRWSQLTYDLTVPIEERLWRPMIEISYVAIRRLLALILARAPQELEFQFTCAEPAHAADVRGVLGEAVAYGTPRNAIRFPSAWLALESPYADRTLHAAALADLQAAALRVSVPVGLRGRVERLLNLLPAGRLSADEAARAMGVSRRTLVRRLSEAGVSYRELLDAELRGRAGRLLASGALSHAQIAEELGYRDPTSFSRANRRWFRPPTT